MDQSDLRRAAGWAALGWVFLATQTAALPPLSANDWLKGGAPAPGNSSAWRPGDGTPPDARKLRDSRPLNSSRAPVSKPEAGGPIAQTAAAVPVGVRRLEGADADGAGIISARQAGLPASFWNGTDLDTALNMIKADPSIPASAQLARRVILAQLAPPAAPTPERLGEFFFARVDRLLEQGALPSARDLLRAAGPHNAPAFRRLFDVALLIGSQDQICGRMHASPGIAGSAPARIYCLAQSGDWSAAAVVLTGAEQLRLISDEDAALLRLFLDDGLADGADTLPPSAEITPLRFRLHEAIGQPLAVSNLDLSFAWSALDERSGWKGQLDAGERLARAGALPASILNRLYTAQRPAASGGVWERAAAIQALEAAQATGDPNRIGAALTTAYQRMEAAGLRDSFAHMVAPSLDPGALSGEPARLALWLRLWAGQTEVSAAPEDEIDIALLALASGGSPASATPALGAFAEIFNERAELPGELPESDLAPALYGALADCDAGLQGDVTRAARGVKRLRSLGLVADARRIATQIALDPMLKSAAQ